MRPRATELLKTANTTAFLVSDPINVRYITGMSLSSGYILVKRGSYTLFTDSRYLEAAHTLTYKDIKVKPLDDFPKALSRLDKCGFEADVVTVSRLKRWKSLYKGLKWKSTSGVIEAFRRSKDKRELAQLKKAERITEALLDRIPSYLQAGVTERDIAIELEIWARELGAEALSFEPIVAFGSNTSRPHHSPTAKKLRATDIVQIDVGAKYNGYCADRSEVFFVGEEKPRQQRMYKALEEAKNAAKKACKAGAFVRDIDQIATDVLEKYNVAEYFTHALGHGVGLDIHEGVVISTRCPDDTLESGEVVTIEPGVYFEGRWGMRLEDMVYVK